MTYGIYIHIPFCRSKCHYCGFYSVPVSSNDREAVLRSYVARLGAEMEERLLAIGGETADTVYFGGGTPSLLPPGLVGEMLNALRSRISLATDAEISLEMNPEDATPEKIAGYVGSGVNRLVLGYQTSRKTFHEAIGRSTMLPDAAVLEAFFHSGDMIRCIDVIVGLPGQRDEDVVQELERVVQYGPHHLSVYCLALEEETLLGRRLRADAVFSERQRECMEAAMDFLVRKGYRHYEISNFALPGYESRHNSKYWTYRPYIGFGPHSHSFFGNDRFFVDMAVEDYLSSRTTNLVRDPRDGRAMAVEYVFTGIRLLRGLSLASMERDIGFVFTDSMKKAARFLQGRGLISIDTAAGDTVIALTREGLFLSDRVIYELVEELL